METMLSALNNSQSLRIKELAVSAIGAIGEDAVIIISAWPLANILSGVLAKYQPVNLRSAMTASSAHAAKELLVPYFPPVIESLKGFLTSTTEEMRPVQTQSLGR